MADPGTGSCRPAGQRAACCNFAAVKILDRNSQICFHKLMVAAELRKVIMFATMHAPFYNHSQATLRFMKNAIATGIMATTILIAGCGKKSPSSSATPPPAQAGATSSSPVAQPPERAIATNAFPQFTIAPGDLASPARVITNKAGSIAVVIKLSDSKVQEYHKFRQDHLNQQIEIVAGSKVLMRLMVHTPGAGGGFGVDFASTDTNAQALADWLNKK